MGKKSCWEGLPEAFLSRLERIIPSDWLDVVQHSFCHKKPTTFRANALKISADELAAKLTERGIEFERVSWYQDAFILGSQGVSLQQTAYMRLMESDLYKNGFLYVQSLSSMIPPIVLDPKPGETILDIAAAPGSKTTQMAAMMENRGEILANDISHVRIYKLQANLALQGVKNTKVTRSAGQVLWQKYPDYADKVLVDVPCSMEGRFLTDDPKSFGQWSTKKIKLLVQTQRFLLRSAISAAKPGGTIMYSTCTMAPEENEGVIDWILRKEKGKVGVLPVGGDFPDAMQGIQHWNEKIYDPAVMQCLRILPSPLMEGFFVAVLKKHSRE